MAALVPVKIPIFWYLSSLGNLSLARVMKAPLKYSRPNLYLSVRQDKGRCELEFQTWVKRMDRATGRGGLTS